MRGDPGGAAGVSCGLWRRLAVGAVCWVFGDPRRVLGCLRAYMTVCQYAEAVRDPAPVPGLLWASVAICGRSIGVGRSGGLRAVSGRFLWACDGSTGYAFCGLSARPVIVSVGMGIRCGSCGRRVSCLAGPRSVGGIGCALCLGAATDHGGGGPSGGRDRGGAASAVRGVILGAVGRRWVGSRSAAGAAGRRRAWVTVGGWGAERSGRGTPFHIRQK